MIKPDDVEVCDFDPGYDVAATGEAELRGLIEVWRGDVTWPVALRSGRVRIRGPAHVRRAVPAWLNSPPSPPHPALGDGGIGNPAGKEE